VKLVLLVLAALGFSYGLFFISTGSDDYVHVYTAGYSIELSFVAFVIILLLFVVVAFLLLRLIGRLWRAPTDVSNWRNRRAQKKSQIGLGKGMLKMIEGDWRTAEKQLLGGSARSATPAAHYLAAARAAQEQGAIDRRDRYLKRAAEEVGEKDISFAISKASMLHQSGQLQQAIGVLNSVGGVGSRNSQVIAMLVQAADELGDRELLEGALPAARSFKALPESILQPLERRLYVKQVLEASAEEVDGVWKSLPRQSRQDVESCIAYARSLMSIGRGSDAEKVLREAIKRSWEERLINLYGSISDANPKSMLKHAERWLTEHDDSAALKLALGRLGIAAGRIEEAEVWLKQAAADGRAAEAYSALGKLREEAGDGDLALDLYRRGLQALDSGSPNLQHDPSAV
jgi:HemY protein